MVLLMVVVPGGLLIAGAWVLARLVVARMRLEEGPQSRRLARAVATLRWRDVYQHARGSLRLSGTRLSPPGCR